MANADRNLGKTKSRIKIA